ncbi:hypothetical protein R6Q59_015427 [Mikania micrantha]|uniref:Uncharacterized protein n=1 Tax=Mikania micrantha TaxID=192012 RepID=A0A5N6PHQ4_9ASTR|nr:hypothetical protein E3N88_08286 [Mikania micrantha]
MASSSPDNKKIGSDEELMEVVVHTGGAWDRGIEPGDAVYTAYNGGTLEQHRFKMPVNFTCSLLHEHVGRAIGSRSDHLTYVLPIRQYDDPLATFIPAQILNDHDVDNYFRPHVMKLLALGEEIEVYHTNRIPRTARD